MAMIHEITSQVGAHKRRKRIGRGPGSGHGKTAGRGHKGAKSRAGWGGSIHPLYEGGQTPYFRRIPKRGFSNVNFATQWAVVNIKTLETRFDDGATIDAATLAAKHLIPDKKLPLKILGEGELTKKLNVTATRFSAGAKAKIESAGGAVTVVELPDPAAKAAAKRPAKKQAAGEKAKKQADADVEAEAEQPAEAPAESDNADVKEDEKA